MPPLIYPLLLLLSTIATPNRRPVVPPSVTLLPDPLFRFQVHGQWNVEADLAIKNDGPDTLELTRLTLRVIDGAGNILAERYAAGNGGVRMALPDPIIPPGTERLAFNPFDLLAMEPVPRRLSFELTFQGPSGPVSVTVTGSTTAWDPTLRLRLPLAGRSLIPNGGDLLSHHRRLDYTDPYARSLGVRRNFMRYALDFLVVDGRGRMYRSEGRHNKDWLGWEAPVTAPAPGRVVAVLDGQPDNDSIGSENRFDPGQLSRDPMTLFGNHVVIDHGGGIYSILAHLREGSVAVHLDDQLVAGQVIGRVGSSGTSTRPHLHYELQSDPGIDAEGLPARFSDLAFVIGDRQRAARAAYPYSGDIVTSTVARRPPSSRTH